MNDAKVIVVGCDVGGYGVIRALSDKPIDCIGLSYDRFDTGFFSRYLKERVRCPHPRKEEGRFIDFLMQSAYKWEGALILASNDHAAVTLAHHRDMLSGPYRVNTVPWDILRYFIEKHRTWKLARECGVSHPETWIPIHEDRIQAFKGAVSFPALIKPIRSHEFVSRFRRKNFLVHNWYECENTVRICLSHGHPVMIQRIVTGSDDHILKCMVFIHSDGTIGPFFYYRKLRQNPPGYGVMRVGESIPAVQAVRSLSEKLLKKTGYRGICTVEFKRDAEDGRLKLIEVNARIPRMNWLATFAGINFPWIAYKDSTGNPAASESSYRTGAVWIELYADILNTLFRHRREKIALADYLEPYHRRDRTFALFAKEDPAPILKKTWTFVEKGGLRIRQCVSGIIPFSFSGKLKRVACETA